MTKQTHSGISRYLKLYALAPDHEQELEVREVIRRLAELLSVSERTVWRYASGDSRMPVAKIEKTVDFLQQYVPVSAEDIKNIFYPTPVEELTQAAEH